MFICKKGKQYTRAQKYFNSISSLSQKPLSVCIFVYTEEGRTEEREGGRKEGRHQHNLVKQLYPQLKSIIKKKERRKQREKEGRKEGEEIPSFLNHCLPAGCFFLPALFSKRPVITLYHSRNERMWFSNARYEWLAIICTCCSEMTMPPLSGHSFLVHMEPGPVRRCEQVS